MAGTNSSGVRSRADHSGRIAPSFPKSATVQSVPAERPFLSVAGEEALRRAVAATDRIRREQYDAALTERGLAEYHEWAETAA